MSQHIVDSRFSKYIGLQVHLKFSVKTQPMRIDLHSRILCAPGYSVQDTLKEMARVTLRARIIRCRGIFIHMLLRIIKEGQYRTDLCAVFAYI